MGDGVVSVDAQRHQDVGRGIGDHHLEEPDELAGQEPRLPGHRHFPNDVGWHGEQPHAEVSQGQVHDEEVHPGPARPGRELRDEHQGVARHDHRQQEADEHELLSLKK